VVKEVEALSTTKRLGRNRPEKLGTSSWSAVVLKFGALSENSRSVGGGLTIAQPAAIRSRHVLDRHDVDDDAGRLVGIVDRAGGDDVNRPGTGESIRVMAASLRSGGAGAGGLRPALIDSADEPAPAACRHSRRLFRRGVRASAIAPIDFGAYGFARYIIISSVTTAVMAGIGLCLRGRWRAILLGTAFLFEFAALATPLNHFALWIHGPDIDGALARSTA